MNFLIDLLTGRRGEREPSEESRRKGMPRTGEPLGFFGRLNATQERAVLDYRGDDTVGDRAELEAGQVGSSQTLA